MPEAEAGEGEVAHAYGTAAGGGCGNSVVREAVGGSGRGEGRVGPELLGAAGPAGRESPRPFNVPGRPSGALGLVSLRPGRLSQGRGSSPPAEGPVVGRSRWRSSAGLAGGRGAWTALRGEGR